MQVLALVLLSCFACSVAFRPLSLGRASSSLMASKKENPALEFLSGKAQIASFKKANPGLFQSNSQTKKGTAKKGVQITEGSQRAIASFRGYVKKPKANGPYDLTDNDIAACFQAFARVIGDESTALQMVATYPDVLLVDAEKVRANLATYTGKWGEEKALGVVTRNPALLAIPTTGYGSAEVAGDDAVVLSYVIAYTRPIGGLLLGLLFAALASKAFTAL